MKLANLICIAVLSLCPIIHAEEGLDGPAHKEPDPSATREPSNLEKPAASETPTTREAIQNSNAEKTVRSETPQSESIGTTLGAARNPESSSIGQTAAVNSALEETADQQTVLKALAAEGYLGEDDLRKVQTELAIEMANSAYEAAGFLIPSPKAPPYSGATSSRSSNSESSGSTVVASAPTYTTPGFSVPETNELVVATRPNNFPGNERVTDNSGDSIRPIDLSVPSSAIVRADGTSIEVANPRPALVMDSSARPVTPDLRQQKSTEKAPAKKDPNLSGLVAQIYRGQIRTPSEPPTGEAASVILSALNLRKLKKGLTRGPASSAGPGSNGVESSDPNAPKTPDLATAAGLAGPDVVRATSEESCWVDFFDKSWMQRCFPTQLAAVARIKVPKSTPNRAPVKPNYETIGLSMALLLAGLLAMLWVEERWFGVMRRIWRSVGVATGLHEEVFQVVELSHEYTNRMKYINKQWRVFTVHSTSKNEIEIGAPIDGGVYPAKWFSPSLLTSLNVDDMSERLMFKKSEGMTLTEDPINCALRPNHDHINFLRESGLLKNKTAEPTEIRRSNNG